MRVNRRKMKQTYSDRHNGRHARGGRLYGSVVVARRNDLSDGKAENDLAFAQNFHVERAKCFLVVLPAVASARAIEGGGTYLP